MSLKFVIDMNLSPEWVGFFESEGWPAVHWSSIGDARASDQEIMQWAEKAGHVVVTHDLDFGRLLSLTHASGPSVILVRGPQVLPTRIGALVIEAVRRMENLLRSGALVVVDPRKSRARVLPLRH
jgi:predicted nuclease of predicted toxin-antitoxin system